MCYLSPMERIGVRELRQHASRYLARVKAGEPVEVTERGQLVARLVPISAAETSAERLVAEGRVLPASGPRRLPEPAAPRPHEPDTGEVLDELRDERL
jgi:prevent-host-death family protein